LPVASAVATGLPFDECPHGHAGDVLERAHADPRLPVGRGGQQHDRRWGAHLEYEQAGVVAGLFIPPSLQPHLPPHPSGKGETGNRKREVGGHDPTVGEAYYPRDDPPTGDARCPPRRPPPASPFPLPCSALAYPQPH